MSILHSLWSELQGRKPENPLAKVEHGEPAVEEIDPEVTVYSSEMTDREKLELTTKRGGSPPNDVVSSSTSMIGTLFCVLAMSGSPMASFDSSRKLSMEGQLQQLKAEDMPPWLARFVERGLRATRGSLSTGNREHRSTPRLRATL